MSVVNKYYIYIVFISLAKIIDSFLYGNNYNDVKLANDGFSKHILMHRLFGYIGTVILSIILRKNEKKKNRQINNNARHKLIYYNLENKKLGMESYIRISLMLSIWIIIERIIDSYFMVLENLDFWMFELLIISILNLKLNKKKLYGHQILGIILNSFCSIFKILAIAKSIDKNVSGILYIERPILYISLGTIFYIILLIMRAYIYITINYYMEVKYISATKIIKIFGIIGLIICSIVFILSTFINCIKTFSISNYICKVYYNNNYYFDNFISIFNNTYIDYEDEKKNLIIFREIVREIFIILLGFLTFFASKYYSLLVIRDLSPVHVLFSVSIVSLFQSIIALIIYGGKNDYKGIKFQYYLAGDITSFIGFLIYLEIILIIVLFLPLM